MVLERGAAPTQFADSVRAVEEERARRQGQVEDYLRSWNGQPPAILGAVPRLRPGVRVVRKPVAGDGVFEWGYVLITDGHPEGLPCSDLVARLATMLDGSAAVSSILNTLAAEVDPSQQQQLLGSVISTLQILYVDGTIEDFGF